MFFKRKSPAHANKMLADAVLLETNNFMEHDPYANRFDVLLALVRSGQGQVHPLPWPELPRPPQESEIRPFGLKMLYLFPDGSLLAVWIGRHELPGNLYDAHIAAFTA